MLKSIIKSSRVPYQKGTLKRATAALDKIAAHYEHGAFIAANFPDEFFETVARDLDRLYKTRMLLCPDCGVFHKIKEDGE